MEAVTLTYSVTLLISLLVDLFFATRIEDLKDFLSFCKIEVLKLPHYHIISFSSVAANSTEISINHS